MGDLSKGLAAKSLVVVVPGEDLAAEMCGKFPAVVEDAIVAV